MRRAIVKLLSLVITGTQTEELLKEPFPNTSFRSDLFRCILTTDDYPSTKNDSSGYLLFSSGPKNPERKPKHPQNKKSKNLSIDLMGHIIIFHKRQNIYISSPLKAAKATDLFCFVSCQKHISINFIGGYSRPHSLSSCRRFSNISK